MPDETSKNTTSAEPSCEEIIEATSFANAEEVERGDVCLPVDDVCARSNGSITNYRMEIDKGGHYASLM